MKKLQQWLAECYHDFRVQTGSLYVLDFAQLVLFTEEQFLRSNLRDSTVHGTGIRPINSQATGRLRGPPILVQIVAVTEFVRRNKPRVHRLKLSDGHIIVHAVAYASTLGHNLSFYNLHLGYKVSSSYQHSSQHYMLTRSIDAAHALACRVRRDCPTGAYNRIIGRDVPRGGGEDHNAHQIYPLMYMLSEMCNFMFTVP